MDVIKIDSKRKLKIVRALKVVLPFNKHVK